VQTLESALRAALIARAPALPAGEIGVHAFAATVRSCEEADRAYRKSIAASLAPEAAREVLGRYEPRP
jgi:hypothetical protein